MGGFQNRYNQAVAERKELRDRNWYLLSAVDKVTAERKELQSLCDRAWQLMSVIYKDDHNNRSSDWKTLALIWYDQYIKQVRK